MTNYEPVIKMRKDTVKAARDISQKEARFLVDTYYQMQDNRIRTANQSRELAKGNEPNETINWLLEQNMTLESEIKRALKYYNDASQVGVWAKSICGVGDVLAAGLSAHVDIHRIEHVSQMYSFAGLNPNIKWEKGQKRPFNADLKVICWKLGESFVKMHNRDADF